MALLKAGLDGSVELVQVGAGDVDLVCLLSVLDTDKLSNEQRAKGGRTDLLDGSTRDTLACGLLVVDDALLDRG